MALDLAGGYVSLHARERHDSHFKHMSRESRGPMTRPSDPAVVEASARLMMNGRYDQAFPTLTAPEIARLRRFGNVRRFADGEALFETGKPAPGMLVVLAGHVAVTARDGVGRVFPVVDQSVGQFLGELGALADRGAALVNGDAEGAVEVLVIPPEGVRALLTAEADLGERIMRAFVLRRVGLLHMDGGGPLLIGAPAAGDVVRLQGFLTRNGHPHHLLDPASDAAAAELIARYVPAESDLPLVICPSGVVLRNPSELSLSRELGMLGELSSKTVYDVAVIGSGPAGLATAVYAASEGLSVSVLEAHAFGGQAGASARIENYFGFPTGISGQALTARAFAQARKFGADIMIPVQVTQLDCSLTAGSFRLAIDCDNHVRARAIVIASGARYRRPAIANLSAFEGRGVHYWASPIEAALCAGQEVILIGGGNSAGQAAVFLSKYVAKVHMMVRGTALAASMSKYLVDRIGATANIEVMTQTEIVALDGTTESGLERVHWRAQSRDEITAPIRHVFSFVGAEPATGWLAGCGVALDQNGFVITGAHGTLLGSSVPGVYAVGDVRAGSTKRVGSAIGEGAQVVAALHVYLGGGAQPGL
jgi:thioredoxin reductase (NADPH)